MARTRCVEATALALGLVLAACGTGRPAPGAEVAGFVAPSIIDSHVHLSYWPVADRLADAGIGAAVDLAAPLGSLDATRTPIAVVASGPMFTRPGGYPIDSWGAGGYGLACADAACVRTHAKNLAGRGAKLIKVAIGPSGLDPALVPVLVSTAHDLGLRVAAHALSDADAALAGAAGCDLLAHTPVEPLRDETVAVWQGRTVISTLAAFGGSPAAIDNLRRLRAAGARVLYGTDLGNVRDAGPNAEEIELLARAGLDGPAIVAAMTAEPATYWGLRELAPLAPGTPSTFVVLASDPAKDPTAYLAPREVWVAGKRRR